MRRYILLALIPVAAILCVCCTKNDEGIRKNERLTVDLAEGVTMTFVKIPAGTFIMGTPVTELERNLDEDPQHEVMISKPYYLGLYEVTQKQWTALIDNNPSQYPGDNRPVEEVSWEDSQTFAQKMNELGQGRFRLPTEAEWEHACRAGTTTAFYWGEDTDRSQIADYAWYEDNSGKQTHDVGLKKPNPWGLFDMSGNVYEWCRDWHEKPYSTRYTTDPRGPKTGKKRIRRGGNWTVNAGSCRSGNRFDASPDLRSPGTGLRLLREYP